MSRYMWAVIVGSVLGLPGSAAAATYNCLPVEVLAMANRFHVQCGKPNHEGGYPKDGADEIVYFAVPNDVTAPKSDVDFAKRFVDMMQTAITAGLVVQFSYASGDTSGATFDCAASNCRTPYAFGLLAPATEVRVPYVEWPSGSSEPISIGQWKYYGPFSISEVRKLVVTMSETGYAELYVRKDNPPDRNNFDCWRPPHLPEPSNVTCTMAPQDWFKDDPKQPNATPGSFKPVAATYFVGVSGGANGSFQLSVSIQHR